MQQKKRKEKFEQSVKVRQKKTGKFLKIRRVFAFQKQRHFKIDGSFVNNLTEMIRSNTA